VSKIRRNEPCLCGSGKKYKRCHGVPTSEPKAETPGAQRPDFARLAVMRHQARQKEIEKQFGLGRPPISFESHGYKMVAVGPELHWSTSWKTFPDFLMSYFKTVLGREWWEAQLAKRRDQWNPLFSWYAMTCEYQTKVITSPGQPVSLPMTGASCGIMWLTYGLYLLRHNAEIQSRLLQRLRTPDPVQIFGALHEVIIAAAMIRAGFDLELENEGDGSQTHCEFTATSKTTGKRFSVEVKVCDPGRTETKDGRPRTFRQLCRALSKTANHPRIVCIDLNRPMQSRATPQEVEQLLKAEIKRARQQENTLKLNGLPAPSAYVVLSIFPFRFDLEGTHHPRGALLEGFKIPRLASDAPFTSLRELSEFNVEHADPSRFAQTLVEMQIPSTLDGELPSRAFGARDPDAPILIGARYLVKDGEGRDVAGELVSGIVDQNQMCVVAVMRLDDANHIITRIPVSEGELNIYRDSPETFLGAYEPSNKAETPVELYERILSVYSQTPRERLLGFLSGHPNIEAFRRLPQMELAKLYAEGIANNIRTATRS
jgi:hypothetical protein